MTRWKKQLYKKSRKKCKKRKKRKKSKKLNLKNQKFQKNNSKKKKIIKGGDENNRSDREFYCRASNWYYENINKNTKIVQELHNKNEYKLKDKRQEQYKVQKNLDKTLEVTNGLIFRGMSYNYYLKLQNLLSPKCPTCSTTIKYHIREGNKKGNNIINNINCKDKNLGTSTNYISWATDYKTCLRYGLIDFIDGKKLLTNKCVLINHRIENPNDACNFNGIKYYNPQKNSDWANKVSTEYEKKYDKSPINPNITILQDWISNDSEILMQIDKEITLDCFNKIFVYVLMELKKKSNKYPIICDNYLDLQQNKKYYYYHPSVKKHLLLLFNKKSLSKEELLKIKSSLFWADKHFR